MILGILGIFSALIPFAGLTPGVDDIVLGAVMVFGLVLAFLFTAVGLPLSGIGLYQSRKNHTDIGVAVAGVATNVVTLIAVVIWVTLIVIGASLTA